MARNPAGIRPAGRVRPTWREVIGQILDVGSDLPVFLTAPLYRRRHLRWGATVAEAARAMPGDDLVRAAQYRSTRAITIAARPAAVWPWLVQVGCTKAGFYSNDLLDNQGRPSATVIIAEFQHLEPGQLVKMTRTATAEAGTAFTVNAFSAGQWLLWSKADSTWAWTLEPLAAGGTRLVTRVRARYDWSRPLAGFIAMILMEFGDFAMLRRMLRGIKARAEAATRE